MRDGAKLSSYGSVDLSNSPISDLGGLDTVQGSLRLNRTKVAGLPANFTVAKTLALKGMKDFRIGAGLCVGDFTAADSDIYFSGDSLTAGRIKLEECGVSFPSTIRCDNLILSKSTIVNVPENIECGGRLYFHTCFSDGFPGRIRTEELWLYKMRCGEFTRAMADLDGDIKAIILAVDDGKLRLGRGFNAGLVAVFDKPKFFTGMSVATARDYLGTHAGSPGALERFARDHGITLLVPGWPSDAKPGSAEEKLRWAEYEFGLS
jgi:hypothetical protein